MLTPTLFVQPPVAVITAQRIWGYDQVMTFSPARSFHIDPHQAIVRYQWDFNGDGVFDYENSSPVEAMWTYPDPHPACPAIRPSSLPSN